MTLKQEQGELCTFELDGLLFGIDVQQTQEIITDQPVTPVPLAAHMVRGLVNLRGQIVTAIDLRECLGLTARPEGSRMVNLIVQHEGEPVSFLVDRMGDVISVDGSMFEPSPETLDRAVIELIRGACKLSDRLLLILDAGQIVRHAAALHAAPLSAATA
ncbi:MAG: chemotaxis protein CheW [Planctomycetota bacterium]|nr:chemotaxis protein CheW [Planctomycetota bacterium]MDA1248704.1 chemotaxis protein CheW [Planctomycetota bacterium]